MMSDTIKPFKATYYNPEVFKNLSLVACPPYDVINKKQLNVLKNKSPYNYSHILLAKDNNYKALGRKMRSWLKENILIDDKKECLYLYEQTFKIHGKRYKRFGILSLLKMNTKGAIFPHEYTLKAPKEDRKKIIKELEANLSPIFVIVPKQLGYLHKIYKQYSRKKPFARFKDLDNNENIVWKIDDEDEIKKICKEIGSKNLVIADGHHRFEVSYDYYKNNKGRFDNLNYILTYVTDAQSGLIILPTHRIVSIQGKDSILSGKLREYFDVIKVSGKDVLENKLNKEKKFSFGFYMGGEFYFFRLKNEKILDKLFADSVYRDLDTYLLHQFVFKVSGVDSEIQYTHSIDEAKKMAIKCKAAFILRPSSLESVFSIANKGYRLPQKSTYFYPKVSSGIVMRRFAN